LSYRIITGLQLDRLFVTLLRYASRIRRRAGSSIANAGNAEVFREDATNIDSFVQLWERFGHHIGFGVDRCADYLRWRYFEHPAGEYALLSIYKNGELIGCAIYRVGSPPEGRVAVICELVTKDEDALTYRTVLAATLDYIRKELRPTGFWCVGTTTGLEHAMTELGFVLVRSQRPVAWHRTPEVLRKVSHARQYFTAGDQDWDRFPKLSQPWIREIIAYCFRYR
jgi:hypothetical protein